MGLRMKNEAEAAEILGVQVRTLRRWRKEERGVKYYTLARNIMYNLSDLEEYKRKRNNET